jgi:tetratricopeptide (TPR) repeat protein
VARIRSQFALASACLEEAAARYQNQGDRWRQGQCATEWARVATEQGQVEQAHALLEDGLLLYQELGDQQRVAWVRYLLARLLFVSQQDQTLARALAEQSLAHFQAQNDLFYSAAPLGLLGLMHLQDGDLVAARPLLEASRAIDKQIGAETEDMQIAFGLARLLALGGDEATARHLYQESLTLLSTFRVHREAELIGPNAATMGIYTNNGTVFTAATTDWVRVLAANLEQAWQLPVRRATRGENVVEQITHNVLRRLSKRE